MRVLYTINNTIAIKDLCSTLQDIAVMAPRLRSVRFVSHPPPKQTVELETHIASQHQHHQAEPNNNTRAGIDIPVFC